MAKPASDIGAIVEPTLLTGPHAVSVTLVGAGGTGGHVLEGLAQLDRTLRQLDHKGLHVTVFDQDLVQPHNIGRQLFGFNDLGENKAMALVARINRQWHTEWVASEKRFEPPLEAAGYHGNILITAVDDNATRNRIHTLFRRKLKQDVPRAHASFSRTHYWLDIGNEKDFGQIVLGSRHLPDCVEEKVRLTGSTYNEKDPQGPSCSAAESLMFQDLFINRIMAAHALDLLWKMFRTGVILRPRIYINIAAATYRVGAAKTLQR